MVTRHIISILVLMLILCSGFTNGQTAEIVGTITDEIGAVIPAVNVKFLSEDGQVSLATSNAEGEYKLKVLPGLYQVVIERDPFTPYRLSGYSVGSSNMHLDITLRCVGCQRLDCPTAEIVVVETNDAVSTIPITGRPLERVIEPVAKITKGKKSQKKKVNRKK